MAESRQPRRRRERWLARRLRLAATVRDDPGSLPGLLRDGLLGIWRSRGGGLYGLGYLVTFVILEVRLVVGEFGGSDSLLTFLSDQLLQYLLRLGYMSLVNALLALLWPIWLLERLGGWGLLILIIGFLTFPRWLRPGLEALVPELRRRAPAEPGPGGDQQHAERHHAARHHAERRHAERHRGDPD